MMSRLSRFLKPIIRGNVSKESPKGLFLHIQKTAGTSIVQIAKEHYGLNMSNHGDHVGKSYNEFLNTKFVSGHFGFDFAKHLMKDRYSFTFLRNPEDRVISMYYFLRGQKKNIFPMYKVAKELSLEQFLRAGLSDPMVKKRLWNNQVWQLALGWANLENKSIEGFEPSTLLAMAKENLNDFNHVGFTETFEKDRDIILRGLRLPIPNEVVITNVSKKPKEKLSDDIISIISDLTELDRRLYDYAKSKFHV
jgi:hypothetical protein